MMTRINELHAKWMLNPGYAGEYERLGPEFEALAAAHEAKLAKQASEERSVHDTTEPTPSLGSLFETETSRT